MCMDESREASFGQVEARVLLRPRRVYCRYRLPDSFEPPSTPKAQTRLATAVGDALSAEIWPVIREMGAGAWLCAFLHGAERPRRVATYDHGRPGSVRFRPRVAAVAVADWRHGLLYASAPKREALPDFLTALNGTLFPGRRPAAPFACVDVDPAALCLLGPEDRRPAPGRGPWAELSLKALAWEEAGLGGGLGEMKWPGDGFDSAESWPAHVWRATVLVRPHGEQRGFVAELRRGGELRAALGAHALAPLAALAGMPVCGPAALRHGA